MLKNSIEYLTVVLLIPVWVAFHFINKYDRSILFVWRNKLEPADWAKGRA